MFYVAREVKRAGYLEVVGGHTEASFVALYELWKYAFRANQYGTRRDFELSHISAVDGRFTIGLLHPENLCVAPKALNKAHGTQYFGHGKSISRSSIKSQNYVSPDEPESVVLDRVIAYLGEQFVDDIVRVAKLQPSKRLQHLDWLTAHLDPANPEHRKYIAGLPAMSTVTMSNLKKELQGKSVSTFAIKTYLFKPFDVLFHELERHAQYRPELKEVFDELHRVNELKSYKNSWTIESSEERALFDLLHGRSVADVQDALDSLLDRNMPVIDYDTINAFGGDFTPEVLERIPAYAPISFPVQRAVVQDTPLRMLATFSIMLDSDSSEHSYRRPMVAPVWEASQDLPPF
ncbi:hypothetical protein OC610_00865 [Pseudomonas sp. SAICEU22]|uniref:Uncharacterized protein n=1 Tax=Pseudomonas agronomica TaxID=2979328 RepID=A0ABT3F336_9PSED|nr:hypothetical protein [Pseudomonas agronomica]MCW1242945.1 hypothetical protein [Pseudomonas agronomica]